MGIGFFTIAELDRIDARNRRESDSTDRREAGSELRGVPRRLSDMSESERNDKIRATFDAIASGDKHATTRARFAMRETVGR